MDNRVIVVRLHSQVWDALSIHLVEILIPCAIALVYMLVSILQPDRKTLSRVLMGACYLSIPILFLMQADFAPASSNPLETYREGGAYHYTLTLGLLLSVAFVLSITMVLTPLLMWLLRKDRLAPPR